MRLPLVAAMMTHITGWALIIRKYRNGEVSFQVLPGFEADQVMDHLAWPGDPAVKSARIVKGERAMELIDIVSRVGV